MIFRVAIAAVFIGLCSCKSLPLDYSSGKASNMLEGMRESSETLTVLSGIGGLCLIAGMVLLVISKGQRGWFPVVGGLILVILNYGIARYSDYLFAPALVFTGMISAAWTYKTVKQILLEKKTK
tara:strand:+ start:4793 stop:5164 length:372 start_codon:yes stop_codon:yes gene_type:complete